jgi:Na+/H+ antiporter NhaB
MTKFIIILTVIACISLAGVVFYSIFAKEKERDDKTDETDDYRDEELNSVYDDYGRNEFDF